MSTFLLILLLWMQGNIQSNGNLYAASTDCSTSQSCITLTGFIQGTSVVTIQTQGGFAGSIVIEGTSDGSNWDQVRGIRMGVPALGATPTSRISTAGTWRIQAAGLSGVRVRCETYYSGSLTASLYASQGAYTP